MMQFAAATKDVPIPLAPVWVEAHVAVQLKEHCFLLNDGRLARQAISCLITPQVGDRVLAVAGQDGTPFIVHILHRADLDAARMSVPGVHKLSIWQDQIALTASAQLELHALRDIDITAATGVLGLNADSVFMTVNETLVQNVRNYIGKASQYLLDVTQLLRLHGQQTLMTAEKDIKVDAERISMG